MGAHYLNLLCDPETPEALELQADGLDGLVNIRSGMRYALRDRIPDFLGAVSGQNKKYQEFYDRIARFYDMADIAWSCAANSLDAIRLVRSRD